MAVGAVTLLTVLHVNTIHVVDVQFCSCRTTHRRTSLLRMAWCPASPTKPRTYATFELLRCFHILNLQDKVTAYDFYASLELLTDNAGLEKLPVCRLHLSGLRCCYLLLCRTAPLP